MRKYTAIVLAAGLAVFAGCTKNATDTGNGVEELRLLGSVNVSQDFQNTGNFDLNLIALDANDNVIQLTGGDVSMTLDSVSVTKGGYSITITDVTYVKPSSTGKIKVAILLDSSGSMSSSDPNYERVQASKDFINLLRSNSGDNKVGIYDFAGAYGDNNGDSIDDYNFRILHDFDYVTDTAALFSALDSVTANGATPLYLSLYYTLDHVHNAIEASYGNAILVLTDGQDNDSYQITADSVIAKAKAYGIPIYAIGLGDSTYIDDNIKRVASETGGVYANAQDANALADIFNSMGFGLSQGYNQITAKINPIPGSGSVVWGKVSVSSGGKSQTKAWSFTAP